MHATLCRSVSRSSRLRSSLRPPGSPTMPVAPPASGNGRWPASWKRRRNSWPRGGRRAASRRSGRSRRRRRSLPSASRAASASRSVESWIEPTGVEVGKQVHTATMLPARLVETAHGCGRRVPTDRQRRGQSAALVMPDPRAGTSRPSTGGRRRCRSSADVGDGRRHRHVDAEVPAQLRPGRWSSRGSTPSTDRRRAAARPGRRPVPGDDVGAVVHAVDEVHVEVARRAEHHLVALGAAPKAVAGRVVAACTPRPRRSGRCSLCRRRGACRADRGRPRCESRSKNDARQRVVSRDCVDAKPVDDARRTARAGRRPASGPAPPGVIRRVTDDAGRDERRGLGAERRSAATSVGERALAGQRSGARARRRWRGPRGTACRARTSHSARSVAAVDSASAAACIRSGTNVAVAIIPVIAAERRARPGRPSRTAAPCPPAGRGCRPAAGPSAWRGGR